MRLAIALAALALSTPAFASEDLAQQLDRIAPLVNASDFAALGGPEDAAGIIAHIDGRWFTLRNTVRNWGDDAVENQEMLDRGIANTCSDTWENLVTYTVTGAETFRVAQQSPEGQDHGSFDMEPAAAGGRLFVSVAEDDYLVRILGLEDASEAEQEDALAEMRTLLSEGLQIWRPTADVMVNVRPGGEPEIWGRCPS